MADTLESQYDQFIARVAETIALSGMGLREITEATIVFDPPFRLHHSHLKAALKKDGTRPLSMAHALAVMKVLGMPPIALICEPERASVLAIAETLKH